MSFIVFDGGMADLLRQLQAAGILDSGPINTAMTDEVDKLVAECDAGGMGPEEFSRRMLAIEEKYK